MSDAVSIEAALRWGVARLQSADIETAGLDARLLLSHATGLPREGLVAQNAELLAVPVNDRYAAMIEQRRGGESVARIVGSKEFWSLSFELGPDTLEPRPDSECIVEDLLATVADRHASHRVLDLGTGTGCLLLSLLSELPQATGVGVDVAPGALEVAHRNANRLGLQDRATFLESDWLESVEGSFDLVISNPPYITASEMDLLAPHVRDFDPALALEGGKDGLVAYRDILGELHRVLAPGASVAMETSPQLVPHLRALIEADSAYGDLHIVKDLSGQERGLRYKFHH